ncbi:transcription factor [Ganoderma sinense ZZ0214-1]|uniref:Transcription factor n=1 Tax=Ganoderma sinense ZZ0214-1 TaxID=1077348 RepID=A0A2G8SR75_9APHY|nr:transcription factor [Ganoderma sinense ZZ0214-1]
MSAQQLPQLCQGAPDFDADSDYLGTPVDPPAHQPYVADFEPVAGYYHRPDGYDGPDYVAGHAGTQFAHGADSGYFGASASYGLLLHTSYPLTISDGCNQSPGNSVATYPFVAPNPSRSNVSGSPASSYSARAEQEASASIPSPSLDQPKVASGVAAQLALRSSGLPFAQHDGDSSDNGDKTVFTKPKFHQQDLTCDTAIACSLPDTHSSYHNVGSSLFVSHPVYPTRNYFDEGYTDSPIDEGAYCDRFPEQGGMAYEQQHGDDNYPHPEPHADSHFLSGLPSHTNVHFYQPPSCPYSYPRIDPPGEGSGYGSSPVSPSSARYPYSLIHAPRPQQVHDIHTLHNSTCPMDDARSLFTSHHVLSIPSIPAPPPIPRPSSLIEDSPKKPLTLACFFCRKRKIACQSPPSSSPDRTCNQCAKRKLKCVYPSTSRRGIRPRVYDLSDEPYRRPSLPLSH